MFRQCVEPTLSVVLELILKNPSSSTEVHQCLGKCMGALITSIGPELQGDYARSFLLVQNVYKCNDCAVSRPLSIAPSVSGSSPPSAWLPLRVKSKECGQPCDLRRRDL